MFIIVGLGNPGDKYAGTRHNIGYDTVARLADKYGIRMDYVKHKAVCGKGVIEGQKVILVQPVTYMNLSGDSVVEVANYYKVDIENIIVLYDDISLDVGQLRLRKKGSAGGHNGIKSIIARLDSQDFPRVKIGVGNKPEKWDLADYVLGQFAANEVDKMEDAVERACNAVRDMITHDIDYAMNIYNKKA